MARLVLLRHGESQWNLENRFTGWVDVPLSAKGVEEAKQAGQKLRGFTFDRAFTSVLIRANETLRIVLEDLCSWAKRPRASAPWPLSKFRVN